MTLLEGLSNKGRRVAGYGASGRANTIIQYCGITKEHLDYMIDDAPAKQGLYTPGSHLPIRNNEALKKDKPDYILLFAWAFFEEIAAKNSSYLEDGGRIIVPLPDVRITMYPAEECL
jgi:methylation protein EvaC